MRVLVIGMHGFLGAYIGRRMVSAGWDVIAAGRSRRLRQAHYVPLDLAADGAADIAKRLVEVAPDAVVNCAGAVAGDATTMAAANIDGPAALLEALVLAGSGARLVHLGSASEYGDVDAGVPVSEHARTRPVGIYGVTKLAGTRLVQLARTSGLDAVVLRIFNPVGAGCSVDSLPGRVAGELLRARTEGDAVRLGPLDAVRDFIDARDVADAVYAALAAPIIDHPILNVGSGVAVPAQALVDGLVSIARFTGAVHTDAAGSPRSAAVAWQQADIRAIRSALGWQPRRELAASLHDLWQSVA